MSSEREVAVFRARILYQTGSDEDLVDTIKKVIQLNPDLNSDERDLLSVAYERSVGSRRKSLRRIADIIEREEYGGNQLHIDYLIGYKSTILGELEKYCSELIGLIDTKLLPVAKSPDSLYFYEKLKEDYYRRICKSKPDNEKNEPANKAKQSYEKALEVAKSEIEPSDLTYIELIVNYSALLYKFIGQKQEAIELAQKTSDDCTNSDSETPVILLILRHKISRWMEKAG
jgi:14-3-3 protein epsilon